MKVYFDTNVFRFIAEKSKQHWYRPYLQSIDALSLRPLRIYPKPISLRSDKQKIEEIAAIVQIANSFEKYPASYRHALELRREIRRLRPRWLQLAPSHGQT